MSPNQIPRGTSIDRTYYFAPQVFNTASTPCSAGTAQYFCKANGEIGTLGRGVFTDDPFHYATISLIKNIPLWENVNLQFRAEGFNIFNLVNLDLPDGSITSPGFGKYTSTIATHSDPPVSGRQFQFGLKLIF
jgi:hypothetical protein